MRSLYARSYVDLKVRAIAHNPRYNRYFFNAPSRKIVAIVV